MNPLDPFRSSVSVSERMPRVKTLTLQECYDALQHTYCLQDSIRKALERRIARLEKAQ